MTSTSGVITAYSRESLFWVSDNGVRFGIDADEATLRALGLDPATAAQAPWPSCGLSLRDRHCRDSGASGPRHSPGARTGGRRDDNCEGRRLTKVSKRSFPINRVKIEPPKPVRVAPAAPIALPEREPRNIWMMIGVPALIVALVGTIVMLVRVGRAQLVHRLLSADGHRRVQHARRFPGWLGRAAQHHLGRNGAGPAPRPSATSMSHRDEIESAACAQRERQQSAALRSARGWGRSSAVLRTRERGGGERGLPGGAGRHGRAGTRPDSALSVTQARTSPRTRNS